MNMFVSTAAVAAGVVDPALGQSADESFAAVEAHRKAWAHLGIVCTESSRLEEILAKEVRRGKETDDPRWIAHESRADAAHDAVTDAETGLINVVPTTVAGAIALLKYVKDHEDRNDEINATYEDTETGKLRCWNYFLHSNLLQFLENVAAG